jgi:peptide methionine sulfoxide reductase MsrB
VRDARYGMVRTAVVCAWYGGQRGHGCPDGPPPTGRRCCITAVSPAFIGAGALLPDQRDRGAPEGTIVTRP